jgi:DNA polymerase-3 subunit beta
LIDGTFPDYERVVPTTNDKIVKLDTLALRQAADRITTIISERGKSVRFDLEAGKIKMSSRSIDYGDSEEEIDADYSGEPLTVGFNQRYLDDILGGIETKEVEIALSDPGAPALIKPTTSDGFYSVLMPLRV